MTKRFSLIARLTRALVISVVCVWLACLAGVTWRVSHAINRSFDHELVEISHRMFDIALAEMTRRAAERIPGEPLLADSPLFASDAPMYQLRDGSGRVLMHTWSTPSEPFAVPLAPGFVDHLDWRIYTVKHPTQDLYLQLSDPVSERRAAVHGALWTLILPMVAALPVIALLVFGIARRELGTVKQLQEEISHRGDTDLTPVALDDLPVELQPLGEDVNRLMERLSKALNIERVLAANAAHELRTPLASVRLRLETALGHGMKRSDVEGALQALVTLTHRAEKLLQMSQAEAGAALDQGVVDLGRLAAMVVEEFHLSQPGTTRVFLRPLPDTPQIVRGDIDTLAIALRNLVENALRHGSNSGGGDVFVQVDAAGTLIVRDTGPGVHPNMLTTLAQRHVRHAATTPGYGVGLSIVRTIADRHGATLTFTSPPDGQNSGLEVRLSFKPDPNS